MASATFSNVSLCQAWATVHKNGGTRSDVVAALIEENDMEDTPQTRQRMYNNVTQRVKQLQEHATDPIEFPKLKPGRRGARRTSAQMQELRDILTDGSIENGAEVEVEDQE